MKAKVEPISDELFSVLDGLVTIVERWPVRWAAEGNRLKDQMQRVRFYNLFTEISDARMGMRKGLSQGEADHGAST